jgi:chemotaxis protein MotB
VTTTKLIIKRSAKKAHNAHHGGAWKVAFADFTLAMMALFMVLWIMGSVTEEERKEIVAQLHGTSIFNESSFNPLQDSGEKGAMLVGESLAAQSESAREEADSVLDSALNNAPKESLESVLSRSDNELEALRQLIMRIMQNLNTQGNLVLEKVPQGLRILIQDDSNRMMFPRGSAVLTPYFSKLLVELAPAFNRLDNKIMISGHTDAAQYSGKAAYNNWNLSGDRALAARRTLEQGGLEKNRIIQVNAMAGRMPLDTENPLADRNRRIEIMVLTEAATDSLFQFYGVNGEKVVKPITQHLR